jgi:Putative auto-transporter adhesin, head GIN domain
MKHTILFLLLLSITFSCSKPSDCVESTGAIITKEYTVDGFTKILVNQGISLVITQGPVQKVEVKTGENLISNIQVKVSDGQLSLKDNTTCNWVREYGQTTVYVTAPNITDFICKTEKNISSNGFLTYPIIRIQVLDQIGDGAGTGDFYFQINNSQVVVESNNVSNFYISGQTTDFLCNFYEGNGRMEASSLLANNISVFHRGSNDMNLFPIATITGNIYSTGDIHCKNHPTTTPTVTSHYHGQLIFD